MQITVDWIRRRLTVERQHDAMKPILEAPTPEGSPTPAAVLIPIVNRPSGLTILLTQRTAHLRDHAGQVSFPGGRCDPTDASAVATALRECREEVGIMPGQVEVLANLPDYCTSTGFRVTPFVGIVSPPLNLKLDDFEVAEVFEPPLDFLLDPENFHPHQVERAGRLHNYWSVPWEGYFIWGATAGMLVSLRQVLKQG